VLPSKLLLRFFGLLVTFGVIATSVLVRRICASSIGEAIPNARMEIASQSLAMTNKVDYFAKTVCCDDTILVMSLRGGYMMHRPAAPAGVFAPARSAKQSQPLDAQVIARNAMTFKISDG